MRILIIEDEPKVSELVKRGLTAERYAVDVSADGREGLDVLRRHGAHLGRLLRRPGRGRRALRRTARVFLRLLTKPPVRPFSWLARCLAVLRTSPPNRPSATACGFFLRLGLFFMTALHLAPPPLRRGRRVSKILRTRRFVGVTNRIRANVLKIRRYPCSRPSTR